MGISRSVKGTLQVSGDDYHIGSGYHTYYRKLTLQQIQDWCIDALVHGAKPTDEVTVHSSISGADSLTVPIPANFEAIPDIPSAGRNAALNRKMVFIAAGAVIVAAAVILALVTVLVVH